MLTEKDLKELIKQGKVKTSDFDFEEDNLQQQKLEFEKTKLKHKQELEQQRLELQRQKLELQRQRLEQETPKKSTFGYALAYFISACLMFVCLVITFFTIR